MGALPWVLAALVVLGRPGSAPARDVRRTPVVEVVERASPAVVGIRVQIIVQERVAQSPFDLFFRDFLPPSRRERIETRSQGSGVIIDPGGYVLTNYHVIAAGGDLEVQLVDQTVLPAEVVGAAPDHDLAVLRVHRATPLPFIPMGTSDDLRIGETVVAIGNPFGLSHTVTTGVVSALHRSITAGERTYADFIQTDAAINPGNSGGPLLALDGSLVGVNTAIYGKAQGIGFAIPIDKAKRIVRDLLEYGEVRRAYFGFEAQDVDDELARGLGAEGMSGAVVTEIDDAGPAAGVLQVGDVILTVGNARVEGSDAMKLQLGEYTVGSRVPLTVLRGGGRHQVTLRPQLLSAKEALARLETRFGIVVGELSEGEARRHRLPPRALVIRSVRRNSPAARYLQPGWLIRAVNSERVLGLDAFGRAMARTYWRGRANLLVQSGRGWREVAIRF